MADLSVIRSIAITRGLKLAEVARRSEMTPQALAKIMRENTTTIKTLETIAAVLNVSPAVFFEDCSKNSISINSGINNSPNSIQTNGASDNSAELSLLKQQVESMKQQITVLSETNTILKELLLK